VQLVKTVKKSILGFSIVFVINKTCYIKIYFLFIYLRKKIILFSAICLAMLCHTVLMGP
jgi:hypothetical protein